MDLLKSYYDKKTKDYELRVRRENNKIFLCYGHKVFTGNEVTIKKFNSNDDFRRFLEEAVSLHMATDLKSVKKARGIWRKMVDFLEDKLTSQGVYKSLKTFLLGVFLLNVMACSSDFVVERSKSEVVTVKGEKFVCEYQKGARIHCDKYNERSSENGL